MQKTCNTMQYHAIPRNTMQYYAILCNIMQYHAIPCNTMQYHAIPCNTMQSQTIPCSTMQYYATQCNTMQYPASLITADGAYHCPVGSIMAIFIVILLILSLQLWPRGERTCCTCGFVIFILLMLSLVSQLWMCFCYFHVVDGIFKEHVVDVFFIFAVLPDQQLHDHDSPAHVVHNHEDSKNNVITYDTICYINIYNYIYIHNYIIYHIIAGLPRRLHMFSVWDLRWVPLSSTGKKTTIPVSRVSMKGR